MRDCLVDREYGIVARTSTRRAVGRLGSDAASFMSRISRRRDQARMLASPAHFTTSSSRHQVDASTTCCLVLLFTLALGGSSSAQALDPGPPSIGAVVKEMP